MCSGCFATILTCSFYHLHFNLRMWNHNIARMYLYLWCYIPIMKYFIFCYCRMKKRYFWQYSLSCCILLHAFASHMHLKKITILWMWMYRYTSCIAQGGFDVKEVMALHSYAFMENIANYFIIFVDLMFTSSSCLCRQTYDNWFYLYYVTWISLC